MTPPSDKRDNETVPNTAVIEPAYRRANFTITIPGSKSVANRAILLAAFAEGTTSLAEIPDSDDALAALSALAALDIPADSPAPGKYRVRGGGPRALRGEIDVRSSGTVGRFLPGLLASMPEGEWILRSSEQLAARPLTPLLDGLRAWGADVETLEAGKAFPLRVRGGGFRGGRTGISVARSSQFASGLLLAAPLAAGECVLTLGDTDPDEAYIDLTLELMRRFGVETESRKKGPEQTVRVPAGQRYRAADMIVEADYNSALYFLCLPLAIGGTARVANLAPDSGQPGRKFLSVVRRLGGTVTEDAGGVAVWGSGGTLTGGFDIDMRAMSEMALTLGVLAVFADKPVSMTNLAHIRGHESDRLAALADALGQFGVRVDAGDDWITVHPFPPRELPHPVIDSRGDHRVAMAFSLLGAGGSGVTIANARAVAKTFPGFFRLLSETGTVG